LGWSGPYFGHQGLVDGELVDLIDGIEGSPLLVGFDLSEGPSRGASIATSVANSFASPIKEVISCTVRHANVFVLLTLNLYTLACARLTLSRL
jgi:hypothetical protein